MNPNELYHSLINKETRQVYQLQYEDLDLVELRKTLGVLNCIELIPNS